MGADDGGGGGWARLRLAGAACKPKPAPQAAVTSAQSPVAIVAARDASAGGLISAHTWTCTVWPISTDAANSRRSSTCWLSQPSRASLAVALLPSARIATAGGAAAAGAPVALAAEAVLLRHAPPGAAAIAEDGAEQNDRASDGVMPSMSGTVVGRDDQCCRCRAPAEYASSGASGAPRCACCVCAAAWAAAVALPIFDLPYGIGSGQPPLDPVFGSKLSSLSCRPLPCRPHSRGICRSLISCKHPAEANTRLQVQIQHERLQILEQHAGGLLVAQVPAPRQHRHAGRRGAQALRNPARVTNWDSANSVGGHEYTRLRMPNMAYDAISPPRSHQKITPAGCRGRHLVVAVARRHKHRQPRLRHRAQQAPPLQRVDAAASPRHLR